MTDKEGQSSTYQIYAQAGWVVYAHQDFPRAIADLAVSIPESVTLEPVEASPYARVSTGDVTAAGRTFGVYVKRYLYRSVMDRMKHLVRPGRAMRTHTASDMLTRHGFLCPVVIATACHRPWLAHVPGLRHLPFSLASATVTLAVTEATPMEEYFGLLRGTLRRRGFLEALGREIGRLHGHHIFHGDLRVGNVLIQEVGDSWRFWLIDNERTCQFSSLPTRRRIKNLVQIHLFVEGLTSVDRWRFFRTYCQAAKVGKGDQRRLARDVIERTGQRERTQQARAPQS
jgi:tRNA A-37 threonylcarbamoyl transferase component Bud32